MRHRAEFPSPPAPPPAAADSDGPSAPTDRERSWAEVEAWARESAPARSRIRWAALREPSFLVGLIAALALVGGGIHMAASMTVSDQAITEPTAGTSSAETPEAASGADASSSAPMASAPPAAEPGAAPAQPGDPASGTAGTQVRVHVVGQVVEPAVVHLSADARVADAIEAAGGLTADADPAAVNLARAVSDGEQIYVPAVGEDPRAGVSGGGASGSAGGGDSDGAQQGSGAASGSAAAGGLINVNTASSTDLQELPGIGPAIAERIIAHREANGPFSSVEALTDVSGIGQATLGKFRDRITV
ncbi:MAG: ComEA family DNA-binding protein [Dermabacter sp.]|nr:ComEA family DNA-binding protein [Dermabacter sp.]